MNMKKIMNVKRLFALGLAVSLTISMLSACGGKDKSDQAEQPAKEETVSKPADKTNAVSEVIDASAMLSIADVEGILGVDLLESWTNDVRSNLNSRYIMSAYECDKYSFFVYLWQESLYSKAGEYKEFKEQTLNHLKKQEKENPDSVKPVKIGGSGNTAYMSNSEVAGDLSWHIEVFYEDYYFRLDLNGRIGEEEEAEWKQEMLSECSELAIKHLQAIIAGDAPAQTPPSELENNIAVSANEAVSEIIYPSQLIARDDVGQILGAEMLTGDDNEKVDVSAKGTPPSLMSAYRSEAYIFAVELYQDALFEKNNDSILAKGGVAYFIQDQMGSMDELFNYAEGKEDEPIIWKVDGIGNGAYLLKVEEGAYMLIFYEGGYYFRATIGGDWNRDLRSKEEELEWRKEKLIEAGELIVERLDAIIK